MSFAVLSSLSLALPSVSGRILPVSFKYEVGAGAGGSTCLVHTGSGFEPCTTKKDEKKRRKRGREDGGRGREALIDRAKLEEPQKERKNSRSVFNYQFIERKARERWAVMTCKASLND